MNKKSEPGRSDDARPGPGPAGDHDDFFTEETPDHLIASEAGSEPVSPVGRVALTAKTILFGRRLTNAEEADQRLSKKIALPIFSSLA